MLYRLLWRPGIKSIRIPIRLSSSAILRLQSQVRDHDVARLPEVWVDALQHSQQAALNLRYDIYKRMRSAGFSADSDWSLAILSAIPQPQIRFADYQYATELLLHLKRWPDLHRYFTELASQQPVMWQVLFLWLLKEARPCLPARFALETLAVSCVNMGLKLEDLALDSDQPIFEMLSLIESRFTPQTIVDAVHSISEGNMVLAAPLATSLLSTVCDAQMQASGVPTPVMHAGEPLKNDLAQLLWRWKSQWSVTTPNDLHLFLLYLVYRRRPREALELYDEFPRLHAPVQSDAVLLAAAVDSDFIRLQEIFEKVEADPSMVTKMGSQRYSTVLRALGYIGDANVLDGIYLDLEKKHPKRLTRGVFHALIQSHGLRGDLARSRAYYDAMIARGIEPTSSTFKLVLRAYKDARDLRGALQFVGDEMIAKHQFGLGNAELSLLLALCAARHDIKSAEYVWKWGTSFCVPDQLSWQVRVHCYAQVNQLDEAWQIFENLCKIHKPSIDTLTALLQAASRFKESPFATKAIRVKDALKLRGDGAWYVALLQHYRRLGDLDMFELAMSEMRTQGVRLNASHYAIYSEILARTKNFTKAKELPAQMAKNRVPISHAFIGKHFRTLTAPGTTMDSALNAERTALRHINEGYFDPQAAMVPRGVVPVGNVKPIVRRLIKRGNLVLAKKLLDSLRIARGSEKPQDTYQLWALYIELAYAARKYAAVDKLWQQFLRDLSRVYVLARGSSTARNPPVYKLARRHRHSFWRVIDAKLDSMAQQDQKQQLIDFPKTIRATGIELNKGNWNVYIQALLKLKEPALAFETAKQLFYRNRGVSRLTFERLRPFANDIDAEKYGAVGRRAKKLAQLFRPRA